MILRPTSGQSSRSRFASAGMSRWYGWSLGWEPMPLSKRCCAHGSSSHPLDLYDMQQEVDYTTLFELLGFPFPALAGPGLDAALAGFTPRGNGCDFSAIQAGDLLVHHPYESFDASVEHFISSAADDPQTVSIKMTAYRIGDDTPSSNR